MAQVVLAEHALLKQEMAIKIIPANQEDELTGRFLQEARVITRLNHPNIIRIFEVGQTATLLFIAMEYMQGGSLEDELLSQRRLDTARALEIVQTLAHCLQHAHSHGVIHRDVKPANILFDQQKSRLVLSDFGAARDQWSDLSHTRIGNTVGSPGYMSPEQCRGLSLDGRSDLYSLGSLLYLMLTGQPPYRGPDAVSIAMAHVRNPPPALPSPLHALQPLIDRAMAKNPEARFQTGLEFAEAVSALQASLSVLADKSSSVTINDTPTVTPLPYQIQEQTIGPWYKRKSSIDIRFTANDVPEFQKLLERCQSDLGQWMDRRGRKAQYLRLHIQAHPWIHRRIQEILHAGRQENTPLGAFLRLDRQIDMILEDDRGICTTIEPVAIQKDKNDKNGKKEIK